MQQCSQDSKYTKSFQASSLHHATEPITTIPCLKMSATSLKNKISIRDYEIGVELGTGSYGRVYIAKDIAKGTQVAIKIVEKELLNIIGRTHQALIEREILKDLEHPNIIKLHHTFQTKDKLYYVLDYIPNGDLSSLIQRHRAFDFGIAQFYAAEIVHVLDYLHNGKGIAHRDLKPENILLDDRMHIKLIDFSTAAIAGKYFDMKSRMFVPKVKEGQFIAEYSELVGTAEYVSPEMINNTVSNETAVDLWSLGCIIYKFFHGVTPFKCASEEETLRKIKLGEFKMRSDIPESAKDIITKLLVQDPSKRLGVNEKCYSGLKSHPFFNGISFESIDAIDIQSVLSHKKLSSQSQSTQIDSIISDSFSGTSFDSLSIVPKQSNDIRLCELEFESDTFKNKSPNVIEDYFVTKFQEEAKKKSELNGVEIIYEGIVTKVSLFEKKYKLKLYSSNVLEYWDLSRKCLCGRVYINSSTQVNLRKNIFEVKSDNESYKFKTTEVEALRWFSHLKSNVIVFTNSNVSLV